MNLGSNLQEHISLDVEKEARLDQFLAESAPDLTRSRCIGLLENGCVKVDGLVVTKKSFRVRPGQQVTFFIPQAVTIETPAEDLGVRIIFEDQDLLVLAKPPGILTHPLHPGQGGSMVSAALFLCEELSGINGKLRPGVVHRLDKETSGVLIMAKNDYAHHRLQRDFHDRKVRKTYYAITYGKPSEKSGVVDLALGRHPKRRTLRKVDSHGKSALTHFNIVKSWDCFHLVHLRPHTGRTHQLRVHLQYLGMPIVHDKDYQGRSLSQWVDRVQLHHFQIRLTHPRSGIQMLFRCPLMQDMLKLIKRLNDGEIYSWSH